MFNSSGWKSMNKNTWSNGNQIQIKTIFDQSSFVATDSFSAGMEKNVASKTKTMTATNFVHFLAQMSIVNIFMFEHF
jgi:hypothetical protein